MATVRGELGRSPFGSTRKSKANTAATAADPAQGRRQQWAL